MSDSTYKSKLEQWQKNTLNPTLRKIPSARKNLRQLQAIPSAGCTRKPIWRLGFRPRPGFPGEPPYTRGIHATMYRGRLWTMRQFAGFGTAEETNERFRYLLAQGQTGLSVAFDLPTLMGYDSDHRARRGRSRQIRCGDRFSGRHGSSLRTDSSRRCHHFDDDQFAGGHPLGHVSCRCRKAGRRLEENLRNPAERYSQGIHRAEGVHLPAAPSMRLVIDTFEFGARSTRRIQHDLHQRLSHSRSGLNRHSGIGVHAARRHRICRMRPEARTRRSTISRRSFRFFFNAHNDFFEEIAKYRAARRIWYKAMTERFKSTNPRVWALAFPLANGGLLAYRAAADKTLSAPRSRRWPPCSAARNRCTPIRSTKPGRCRQNSPPPSLCARSRFIAHETGVTNTVDPLGGSYFVETLTNEVENAAWEYIHRIDAMGGMVAAIEKGYPQREIAEASYAYQMAIDKKGENHRRRQRLRHEGKASRYSADRRNRCSPPGRSTEKTSRRPFRRRMWSANLTLYAKPPKARKT